MRGQGGAPSAEVRVISPAEPAAVRPSGGEAAKVPLAAYLNDHGRAKLELGLAKGKRKADKRDAEKARDWQRDKARVMRENNR